ncbi:hypothetical protein C0Q98_30065 [Streptomyces albidoflavus]|nr:hypothetical protein [Streptomyces sp. SID4915]RZE51413.1 hypothetical protein C0Q98_30065 [Streptomyces albidoflavus]
MLASWLPPVFGGRGVPDAYAAELITHYGARRDELGPLLSLRRPRTPGGVVRRRWGPCGSRGGRRGGSRAVRP